MGHSLGCVVLQRQARWRMRNASSKPWIVPTAPERTIVRLSTGPRLSSSELGIVADLEGLDRGGFRPWLCRHYLRWPRCYPPQPIAHRRGAP